LGGLFRRAGQKRGEPPPPPTKPPPPQVATPPKKKKTFADGLREGKVKARPEKKEGGNQGGKSEPRGKRKKIYLRGRAGGKYLKLV